jgi:hypothetical protein
MREQVLLAVGRSELIALQRELTGRRGASVLWLLLPVLVVVAIGAVGLMIYKNGRVRGYDDARQVVHDVRNRHQEGSDHVDPAGPPVLPEGKSVTTPPPPKPGSGWYPDPGGAANTQRYFDGTEWTDQLAPLSTPAIQGPTSWPGQHVPPGQAKHVLAFQLCAIVSPVVAIVSYVAMQLAFGADEAFFEVLGFAIFVVFIASIVATVFGIVMLIVGRGRQ